jgi:hypothetical protein
MKKTSCILFLIHHISMALLAQPVPYLINYQGRLTDASGQPLSNGTYAVQFRLWNKPLPGQAGESLVWGQQSKVTLVDGVFNAILGAPGGIAIQGAAVNDLGFGFAEPERYLGLTVVELYDGKPISESQRKEILPRQQLLSAPFALRAERAEIAASLVTDLANALCPPGTIVAFGGIATEVPDGWLLCDGRPLPKADARFGRLYRAIRTAWGEPDSGTFRAPDLRGVFLRGVDDSPLMGIIADREPDRDGRSVIHPGGNSGNQVGSYEGDAFASHDHEILPKLSGNDLGPGNWLQGTVNKPASYGSGNTGPRGGSETRPKNVHINYIIKY